MEQNWSKIRSNIHASTMFKLPKNSIIPISIEAEAPQSIMQVSTHPPPSPSPLKIPNSKAPLCKFHHQEPNFVSETKSSPSKQKP
jgi:hypothetical protein